MTEPEVWWSPSLAEDLSQGGLIERTGPDLWHQEHGLWHRLDELPADAVRLVPESEVQFVLDDNERMLAQHASDVAEIERLREDKRLFQDMFMSATAHNTAVCEALGLSYEAETETVVAAIQKALHPMLMLDSETGAVSLAGAVPDTVQAPDVTALVADGPLGLSGLADALDSMVTEHKQGEEMDEGWMQDIATQLRAHRRALLGTDTTPEAGRG